VATIYIKHWEFGSTKSGKEGEVWGGGKPISNRLEGLGSVVSSPWSLVLLFT